MWIASFSNLVFLSAVALLFRFYAENFAAVFSDDPAVVDVAALCLQIIAFGYPALAFGMVTVQGVQRSGRHDDADVDQPVLLLDPADPAAYLLSTLLGLGPQECS